MAATETHTRRETPLMTFWRGMNEQLRSEGYPELRFGDARRLYDAAITDARTSALQFAIREAA